VNVETEFLDMIDGMFESGGALVTTHIVDATGTAISPTNVMQAKKKYGEKAGGLGVMLMHPNVFYDSEIAALTSNPTDFDTLRAVQETGSAYMGNYAGMKVILNERVGVSGSTYNTYLIRPGALLIAGDINFEIYRDPRLAAGTWVRRYVFAGSMHVFGVTWNTTEPSGLGGATDAAIATAASWAKRTGADNDEIGIVCIKSDATAA
jgi:hypothetical protein